MDPGFDHIKRCSKCGGHLVLDDADLRCWQCGQYYYSVLGVPGGDSRHDLSEEYTASGSEDSDTVLPAGPAPGENGSQSRKRKGYGARSVRNINSVIRAKVLSEQRWRTRNKQILEYLDKGMSVRQIAKLVGRGERQIRVVRERLADLGAATEKKPQAGE